MKKGNEEEEDEEVKEGGEEGMRGLKAADRIRNKQKPTRRK